MCTGIYSDGLQIDQAKLDRVHPESMKMAGFCMIKNKEQRKSKMSLSVCYLQCHQKRIARMLPKYQPTLLRNNTSLHLSGKYEVLWIETKAINCCQIL